MRKIDKLLFGPSGIPMSIEGNTVDGINGVKKLGLNASEMLFVHSINVSEQLAKEVKKTAEQNDIVLTCHGSYYINLNSQEKAKADASVKRILDAVRRTGECGGWSVVFHPAFYMGQSPEKVYEVVKTHMTKISKTLKNENVNVWIRPETTGKATQFGTLRELCKLSQEVENVLPCIDFAHMHARTGKENTLAEFKAQLGLVEKTLGKEALKNMHCHMAGINYGEKGEKNHLNLKDSDLNYKDLVKVWKEFKIQGVIISESPNIEGDALLLQKEFRK
ncbi:MAG: TIM barrel protein [Nanoarchaeota archaeon]